VSSQTDRDKKFRKKAEFSAKKGHMVDAAAHEQLAEIINNFLKTYD
jgi:hypothetical protein